MLHRLALAAALAACAFAVAGTAYSQAVSRGGGQVAQQAEPSSALRRAGRDGIRQVSTANGGVVYATTSFSCTNSNGSVTTYTLSVDGGSCGTHGPANGQADQGLCGNTSGASASANCTNGCIRTEGSGSCTQTTTRAP